MYIIVGRGPGDAPSSTPWRVRLGLRPKLKTLCSQTSRAHTPRRRQKASYGRLGLISPRLSAGVQENRGSPCTSRQTKDRQR
jgi:hypothetical protein